MDKEKMFSRINSRDYNNELEAILENKKFSENIKNLLLSMLYKVENGYKDYQTVKRIVQDKKNYIEEILKIIKDKCNSIEIIKEDTKGAEELKKCNTQFLVDTIDGNIKLMYPNEKLLLYTIYKLDNKQVYLDEKYNLIRNSLSELLNFGENINSIEVLRDFNGWSWNTEFKEIPEVSTNLIYQNLIYLLGIDFIKEWINKGISKDYIPIVEEKMISLYGKENSKELLDLIYIISIIISTDKNKNEKQRLLEEKRELEKELKRMNNKSMLLTEISNNKKEALSDIKKIDKIMNDKKLLQQEFDKQNEKRAEYNKIFNMTHLTEILEKQRKKAMKTIEENNKILDPTYYVETKQNIENQLKLLADIDNPKKDKNKEKYLIDLQKVFLKCFEIKIEKSTQKEEIIDLIYMYRYYNYNYIKDNVIIKQEPKLNKQLNEIQYKLVQKALENKVLNKICNTIEGNNLIFENSILRRIINLEEISIEILKDDKNIKIKIFDGEIPEDSIQLDNINKEDIIIKNKKRIKLIL